MDELLWAGFQLLLIVFKRGATLTHEERVKVLQAAWCLTIAVRDFSSWESSMCHGYNTNTWNINAHSEINNATRGIHFATRDSLGDDSIL